MRKFDIDELEADNETDGNYITVLKFETLPDTRFVDSTLKDARRYTVDSYIFKIPMWGK